MLKTLLPILSLSLCAALLSCAPPAVPSDASVHWDLKSDFYWTWTRRFDHGCVAWTAKDDYASVDLLVDSQCEERREIRYLNGLGINYFSSSDEIVFRNYWPRGEMHGGDPCPHQISDTQIAALRRVAAEALAETKTDGERRVLNRIDERLSVVNGDALMTYHGGWCSDSTAEDWETMRRTHINRPQADAWQDGQ
jgi:hypothetical protein